MSIPFDDKTPITKLRTYLKENNLEELFKEQHNKSPGKCTKKEILTFLKNQNVANNIDNIICNALKDTQPNETNEPTQIDYIKTESIQNNEPDILEGHTIEIHDIYDTTRKKEEDPEIEEIPVFKNETKMKNSNTDKNADSDRLDLNCNQRKVLKYITRFPEKLKIITSRPTFKQEFATLKDYNPEQNEEENLANEKLRHEIEQTLNGANIGSLVLNQIFVTVNAVETIIVAIRENKNGKIPAYIVDTIGQVRIEGLAEVLQNNRDFHDCIDELLIKYDSYEGLLKYLNVETRLMLIILGSAYLVHKGNVKKEALKQESESLQGHAKVNNVRNKYKDL